ncbi:uncharacterized protein itprid1 isoform X2 [Cheilinus undulatus]|uniref:uncharacterized protein itprid1 isoform X2 n=1 Tax=Cheilinus undulatus TaxID=241271 RepID=UPI001BD54B6E|nr:uncharacterized protein itprid1 isoform X2 [Cheilinus undulatus]
MASDEVVAKRANLVASRIQWGHADLSECTLDPETQGSSTNDSVRKWLSTAVTEEDAKHEPLRKSPESVKRNTSCDDDLALGVEASLYGIQRVRTVQDFLRWTRSSPSVSRWNSFNSTTSDHSGPLSVMDILNLWNDDPEEVLLDLGFGCDEPDLSGRIPARFMNYQSQARGINLQVFLEAQKNRLDLENPDVSNRFRQIEVLQQVTTAFSSLVGSSSALRAPHIKDLSPEARERRKRMSMLFRQASKKTLSNYKKQKTQDLSPSSASSPPHAESHLPPASLGDKGIPLKRVKIGPVETTCLSPLVEELGPGPDVQSQPQEDTLMAEDGPLRPLPLREGRTVFLRRKSPGQVRESFEMEEIHSFDDNSVTGGFMGGAENLVRCVARSSSCQSDSSGFLEDPVIPPQSQQESPAPDLIKALLGLSGGSTDSHNSERPPSPSSPHTSPTFPPPSSLTSSSPRPSPELPLVFDCSRSPALLSNPEPDLDMSETGTPLEQARSPPASFPEPVYENSPTSFSFPELEDMNAQSKTPPSPASVTPISSRSSLIRVSGEVEMDKGSPSPILASDSDPTVFSAVSNAPSPSTPPARSSFLDQAVSSMSFSSEGPGDTQEYSNLDLLFSTDCQSSHLPANPSDFHSEALQGPETNKENTLTQDLRERRHSDMPCCKQTKEEKEVSSSHLLQSDQDGPLDPPDVIVDFSRFGDLQPSLSPTCEFLSSESHSQDSLIGTPVGVISDSREQSCTLQDLSHPDNDTSLAWPVQDGPADMDHGSFYVEDTLQGDREGSLDATSEHYSSQTESFAGLPEDPELVQDQKEIDPQVLSYGFHGEQSSEREPEELTEVCQMDFDSKERGSPRTSLDLNEVLEEHDRNYMEPKGLFEIESLDVVFQTSVDGSEGENGDLDAYFQQLDTERQVYWAEPIQVSSQNSSGSFEASDRSLENLPKAPTALDSPSTTGRATSSSSPSSPSTPTNPKPSSRSVSVQMSSNPSSHIVHRRDVPCTADSKHTLLPPVVPLDTSSPFRAVQSWTDWQIQRNNHFRMLSHGASADTVLNEATGVSETTQRPTLIFSSSPSLPLLSKDWQSHDCLPGMAKGESTVSVSLDKGLWSDEEEEDGMNGNEDERDLWEGNQMAQTACCCSCDHQGLGCNKKQHNYSLDELEEMMLYLQQFRSVLNNMEEQLSEDQAAVFSALSDQDREKVRDIEELRRAVKKEAGELEMQLNELAHHYDDSLKMKMHRLLDEQSLLCTQLRVSLPGKVPTSLYPAPNRTVATQCCLNPRMPSADVEDAHVSSWREDSPRQSPPGSDHICDGLACSPTKAGTVDLLSFLQRLKESLRHSVNMDSLE